MNPSGSAPLGTGCDVACRIEQQNDEKRDEIAAMVFASLLTAPPSVPPPRPACGAPAPVGGTADAAASIHWRSGASGMTGEATASASTNEPITTHIESDELGRVSVCVDPSGPTVRVVVSADRPEVLAAMQLRHGELLHQLQSAGIAVSSLSLLQPSAFGTSLARVRSTGTPRGQGDESPDEGDGPGRGRQGRRRNVNLTG